MTIADVPGSGVPILVVALAMVLGGPAPDPVADEVGVVDRIVIRGNMRTRDRVIRRELGIVEMEAVDLFELGAARRRLRALGYFMVAAVSARSGPGGRVTIAVDVIEPPRANTGFSSVENFIAICAIRQSETRARP